MNDYLQNCAIIFVENTIDFAFGSNKMKALFSICDSLPCYKYWVLNSNPVFATVDESNVLFIDDSSVIDNALINIIEKAKVDGNKKFLIVSICELAITSSLILEGLLNLKVLDVSIGPTKEGGLYLIGFKDINYNFLLNKDWKSELLYKSILKDLGEEKLAMYRLPYLSKITTGNSDESIKK